MEFFGFVLVHVIAKEDSEKCTSKKELENVNTTNVANFILEEPMTIEMFIKNKLLDKVAIDYSEKGVNFFIECLTLRCKEGSAILKVGGSHCGRHISEAITDEAVFVVDHNAIVIELP